MRPPASSQPDLPPPVEPLPRIRHLLCFAFTSFLGLAPNGSAETWVEVQTEHFTVLTSAGEAAGVATANRLEALHRALSRMAGTPRDAAVPTRVFVFSDDDELHPFKPAMAGGRRGSGRAVAGGFFAPRELANFVAVNARTSQPISSTIQHELLHQFANQHLPRLPFWFSEGLAEYYSTFQVSSGVGIIGRPHRGHLRALTSSPTATISGRSLERVTELRATKELYDDAGDAGQAYALSWALVHYLLSDDRHAASTLEFMRGLARGQEATEAFEEAFGRAPKTFAGSVARYLVKGHFPEFEVDLSRVPSPRVRSLSAVERDLALCDLALVVSKPGLATNLLERAWAEAERDDSLSMFLHGGLQVASGRLRLLSEDLEGARLDLLEASRLAPTRVDSHLYLARTLLAMAAQIAPAEADRAVLISEAREAASRAADVAPNLVPALDTLAQTWIVQAEHVRAAAWPPEDLHVGIRALESALEEDRYRADLATRLAVLQALGEDLGAALDSLRRHRLRYDQSADWDAAVLQAGQIELRLLSMRGARVGRSDEQAPPLEERIAAFIEHTYEFDALTHLFADARALQDDLVARREESTGARR